MATNQDTVFINTFVKGMNTDSSVQMIQNDQYINAKNIRVFPLSSSGNQFGEIKSIEGVRKILETEGLFQDFDISKILAAETIRNYGIIILEGSLHLESGEHQYSWTIVRLKLTDEGIECKRIFTSTQNRDDDVLGGPDGIDRLSVELKYEDEDNIKLYIADGYRELLVINILDDEYNDSLNGDFTKLQAHQSSLLLPPVFCGLTAGNMTSGMVSYAYVLYNKNGISTDMSIPTKLIPIVYSKEGSFNGDGKNINGADKDKHVGQGVRVKIHLDNELKNFNRIQLYRIKYVETGQEPEIDLIFDRNVGLGGDDVRDIYFVDSGNESLQHLTLEEFNGLSGIHIIPKVIESKYDYLFAANIKDTVQQLDEYLKDVDTRCYSADLDGHVYLYKYSDESNERDFDINSIPNDIPENADCYNIYNNMSQTYADSNHFVSDSDKKGMWCRFDKDGYYGGTGKYVSWRFIITELSGDDCTFTGRVVGDHEHIFGTHNNIQKLDNTKQFDTNIWTGNIDKDGSIQNKVQQDMSSVYDDSSYGYNYSNPVVSYALKSLRRDELYRYGIIFYNKLGQASSVKWIQDIRTPAANFKGFEPFIHDGYVNGYLSDLTVRSLGIQFNVDIEAINTQLRNTVQSRNLDYSQDLEIVGYEIVRCNRDESDINTITQGVISRPVRKIINKNATKENIESYPYTPTGLLTTANFWSGKEFVAYNTSKTDTGLDKDEVCNYENHYLYQFVSPEVVYQNDYIEQLTSAYNLSISPITYMFQQTEDYQPNNYYRDGEDYNGSAGDNKAFAQDGVYMEDRARFIQIGSTNMQYGMPILPGEGSLYVGSEDSADNKLDNISSKSIFSPVDYDIVQYYCVYPQRLIMGFGSDSGGQNRHIVDGSTLTYRSPGSPNDTQVTYVNRSSLPITKFVYGYSKLYHTSKSTYLRKYSSQSDYESTVGSKTEYDTCDLSQNNVKYTIESFKVASEIGWNEMFTDQKNEDGNNTTIVPSFQDNLTVIDNYQYSNVVSLGVYGNAQDYINENDGDGQWAGLAHSNSFVIGPAGRTALITLDDDNIFYKTIATDTVNNYVDVARDVLKDTVEYKADVDLGKRQYDETTLEELQVYDNLTNNSGTVIFRNSVAGTYLCNIRKSSIPYGGADYTSRTLNTYYSYGDVSKKDSLVVFDGDCVIMPLEYVSQHKYWFSKFKYPEVTCFIYSIPVETNINLAYTYGNEFSRNYQREGITNIQIEPSDVYGYYSQSDPLYNYNTVYSSQNSTKLSTPYISEEESNNLQNVDYRIYYSNPKTNNESIDSWSTFMPNNYIDVDNRYGEVTNMESFKDKMVFWQNNAVGLLSVNERAQITDDNGQMLILGNGGVLSRYDYLDQTSGMSPEKYCDTESASYLYWYDDKNKEIRRYGDQQYQKVNTSYQTNNLMQKEEAATELDMFYDQKYQEIVSNVLAQDNQIVFNEKYNMFTSLYDMVYNTSMQFDNDTYLVRIIGDKELGIYKWNEITEEAPVNTQDNAIRTYVQYVVNPNPLITKTFDNQEIVTSEIRGYDSYDKDIYSKNYTYVWETDLNRAVEHNLKYTDREGNFRYSIPRALTVAGNTPSYGNRVRGKYMLCTIENEPANGNTSISYIITKYRQSWT